MSQKVVLGFTQLFRLLDNICVCSCVILIENYSILLRLNFECRRSYILHSENNIHPVSLYTLSKLSNPNDFNSKLKYANNQREYGNIRDIQNTRCQNKYCILERIRGQEKSKFTSVSKGEMYRGGDFTSKLKVQWMNWGTLTRKSILSMSTELKLEMITIFSSPFILCRTVFWLLVSGKWFELLSYTCVGTQERHLPAI